MEFREGAFDFQTSQQNRNGTSSKTLRSSEYGEVPLAVPRDRNGEFEPTIIKKNQTTLSGLEDQIIAMYTKGLSTRDIQDHFANLYGAEGSVAKFYQNVYLV